MLRLQYFPCPDTIIISKLMLHHAQQLVWSLKEKFSIIPEDQFEFRQFENLSYC